MFNWFSVYLKDSLRSPTGDGVAETSATDVVELSLRSAVVTLRVWLSVKVDILNVMLVVVCSVKVL